MLAKKSSPRDEKDEIVIIQQTDVDAKSAKRSAAALGYLNDPFIADFVRVPDRKPPIINRGTYVRTRSIDHLIETVLLANSPTTTQIVSLGAGSDTRFFNLQTRLGAARSLRYHEFDFQKVANAKAKVISEAPHLRALVHSDPSQISINVESGTIVSPTYCLHSMDIRRLPFDGNLPPYLDVHLPTVFLSECCLVYMDQEDASRLLRWISETFVNDVGMILYEPIGGHDAFGRMMIRNLATRGINLKTLSAYPTLQKETLRLKDCGFVSGQDAIDINFAHDRWMGKDELGRISRLELLDEMEEWQLLAAHYCITWAWKTADDEDRSHGSAFDEWANIRNTLA